MIFFNYTPLIAVVGLCSLFSIDARGRAPETPSGKEQVTYLGVRTEGLPPAMSKQLSLPIGLHLSVVQVGPNSPAENAGLQEFDVLLKLDDQTLVNEDQLKKLVRLKNPQEQITLSILRNGKSREIQVVLEETEIRNEVSRSAFSRGRHNDPFLKDEFFNDFWDERFEDFIMKDPGFGLRNNQFYPQVRPNISNRQSKIRKDLEDPLHQPGSDIQSFSYSSSQSQKVITDEDGTLEWTEKDGEKFLRATDPSGNLLFEGPVNTDEEKAKIPLKLSKRLKKLEGKL
jgi:serine protease Do